MAACAALCLMAGAPAQAQVPDPFARELAQKLAFAEAALAEQDYMRAAGPFAGGLAQNASRQITLTLRAGQDYRIVGVCEQTCGAPSLRLIDPNQRQIARGMPESGASVMHVRVAFMGAYNVDVQLPRCAAAQCWYAVNVYAR